MTEEQARLLTDVHGQTQKILGILTGGNGGGLQKDVRDLEADFAEMKKDMVTRESCFAVQRAAEKGQQNTAKRRWRAWDVIQTALFLVMTAVALAHTFGIL